jgi:hypothetical protein
MNTTEKAIIVGLGLLIAVGLTAGAAYGFVGQTSAARQQRGGGMMSDGSGQGLGGMMGGSSGGMMGGGSSAGGLWGIMGNHGLVTNGDDAFMGCIQYMANFFGFGANGRAS